jgi:hypothetical protein
MSNAAADIISQLDTLNQQAGIDVYVPSLKRFVKFKPLNLRQQKNLLKSSVEETLTRLSFITSFYTIIQENILETIDISNLYIFDRIAIAIALRSSSLDNIYTFGDISYNLNDKLKEIPLIDASDYISCDISIDNISLTLEIPRLGIDRDVCSTVLNKLNTARKDDIRSLIGDLFINEIIKFIKNVTIKTEAGEVTTNFADLKIDNRLSIAEKFPTTLTKQILDYIKLYRKFEDKFTKITDASSIEIDGSFFAI